MPENSAGHANASPLPQRFHGRRALITGGARGQGEAHGERLAREGAEVVLADVLDEDGEATARRLRAEGLAVSYAHLDVASAESWEELRAELDARWGRLDVLVNNAGVITIAPLGEHSLEAWNRVISINLTGAFLGLTAMLPLLRAAAAGAAVAEGEDTAGTDGAGGAAGTGGTGSAAGPGGTAGTGGAAGSGRPGGAAVVNTASVFGPSGAHGYAAYGASKAGLLGLTRTAALELAPAGIRVNALVPGGVSTAINADEGEGIVPETPMGRRARVDELAAAVAYLAGDDASFVTGTELVVDGGFRAR